MSSIAAVSCNIDLSIASFPACLLQQEKYRHYVERILRWGEIAAGLRGNVTLQSLRSDLRNHCSDDDISMYASPSRQSSGTIIRNRPMEHVST